MKEKAKALHHSMLFFLSQFSSLSETFKIDGCKNLPISLPRVFTNFYLYYVFVPSLHIITSVLTSAMLMNGYFLISLPSSFKYFSLSSEEISQQKLVKMTNNFCRSSFSANNETSSTLLIKWFLRLPIDLFHLDFNVIASHSFSDIIEYCNDASRSTDEQKWNNMFISFGSLMDPCVEFYLVSSRATTLSDTFLTKVCWKLCTIELQKHCM